MTRERKLAIQMWEEVKRQLPGWCKEYPWAVADFLHHSKIDFCEQNGLLWQFDCWFCQYINNCDKCPLRSCDFNNHLTIWHRIVSEDTSLKTKLQAVDEIIAVLKGGIK